MSNKHPHQLPSLVFANKQGEIIDFGKLSMAGRSCALFVTPSLEDLIPLPEGSELFVLPDRLPVGTDPKSGEHVLLDHNPHNPNEKIQAVAAFMAPAYTATHTAAFEKKIKDAPHLPLFAYTAVGWAEGKFWVSAFRSDLDDRQDAKNFDQYIIDRNTQKKMSANSGNRLIQHLGKCCLTYGCPAARNYFLGRWEAPLPSSPACNARCVGCISLQSSGCCPSTQDRINFVPTPKEIAEIAVSHLNNAEKPIVSFGQGCEGEPLLQVDTLEKAIRSIRNKTDRGTINLNSNASVPSAVERLCGAGLDSIRVSMNSARKEQHYKYYLPSGFDLSDVFESIAVMKKNRRFVSLNYFILPGFTDDPDEFEAFCKFIDEQRPDLIQLRNLNMDPDWYIDVVQHNSLKKPIGINNWHAILKKKFPWLRYGYFNPSL